MRALISLLLLTSPVVFGQEDRAAHYLPLNSLFSGADAIVVVTAIDVAATGTQANATLRVMRSVKGDLRKEEVVYVIWEVANLPDRSHQGETGMWFLRRTPESKWTALLLVNSDVPFIGDYFLPVSSTEPLVAMTGSPEERLAEEMAHAIEQDPSNLYIWNWMDFLRGDTTAAFRRSYARLAKSATPAVRAFGIGGLIRQGLPAGYQALLDDDKLRNGTAFPTDLLAAAICETQATSDIAEFLKALATPETPKFSRCANEKLAALQ